MNDHIIFICSRTHSGEAPASLLVEGVLRSLLKCDKDATIQKLLTLVEIHIVPMINPDGFIAGNSRTNLAGVDLNRKWGDKVINE